MQLVFLCIFSSSFFVWKDVFGCLAFFPSGVAQAITLRKRTSNRNARDESGKFHPFSNPKRWTPKGGTSVGWLRGEKLMKLIQAQILDDHNQDSNDNNNDNNNNNNNTDNNVNKQFFHWTFIVNNIHHRLRSVCRGQWFFSCELLPSFAWHHRYFFWTRTCFP